MSIADWLDKVLVGGLGKLEAQNAAQHAELLDYPRGRPVRGAQLSAPPVKWGTAKGREALSAQLSALRTPWALLTTLLQLVTVQSKRISTLSHFRMREGPGGEGPRPPSKLAARK